MKLIDLLNKIANGEDTPQVIRFDGVQFELNDIGQYRDKYESSILDSISYNLDNLNEEVVIMHCRLGDFMFEYGNTLLPDNIIKELNEYYESMGLK